MIRRKFSSASAMWSSLRSWYPLFESSDMETGTCSGTFSSLLMQFRFPFCQPMFHHERDLLDHRGGPVRGRRQPVQPQGFEGLSAFQVRVPNANEAIGILGGHEYSLRKSQLALVVQLVALPYERSPLFACQWCRAFRRYLEKSAGRQLFQDVLCAHPDLLFQDT